jgi:hypothetical protein
MMLFHLSCIPARKNKSLSLAKIQNVFEMNSMLMVL